MEWFILGLIAPALWAVVILIDDNLIRDVYRSATFGAIVAGLLGGVPALVGAVGLKPVTELISLPQALLALAAGMAMVGFYWLFFQSLETDDPSIVTALSNMTSVLVPVLAFIFLGEVLKLHQYLGIAIVLGASVALAGLDAETRRLGKVWKVMLAASALLAFNSVAGKYLYTQADFWSVYVFVSAGMVMAALGIWFFTTTGRGFLAAVKQIPKPALVVIGLAELLNVAAELTFNRAISLGPVSAVRVLEATQPIFILLIAVLLFPLAPQFLREGIAGNRGMKLALMAVMIVGVGLIAQSS
jgi:drug/metabolite transporter (DMT)-like permease